MRQIRNVTSEAAELVAADAAAGPEGWDYHFRDTKGRVVEPPDVHGAPIADTHCHLDMLPHPELALARAAWHGLRFVVTVVDPTEEPGYTYEGLDGWLESAEGLLAGWAQAAATGEGQGRDGPEAPGTPSPHAAPPPAPRCRIIAGCHPHNASKYDAAVEAELLSRLADPLTAAVGEIGLDYHYDTSPRDVQREAFRRQLAIAHDRALPVALHLRDAHEDGLAILDQCGWPEAGVLLHCYTLGTDVLLPFLDKGAQVAFGGTLTFKKADALREAARQTAPERIMTETDAPFMTPTPLRGTLCGPEHTLFTAACLAEVQGAAGAEQVRQLLEQVYANALAFFDRQPASGSN